MNVRRRRHRKERLVRGYTHFLLFFVVFSVVLTYSIALGVGWGVVVAVVANRIWEVIRGGSTVAPATSVLITEAVWLFVAGLILHSLTAIRYDRDTGYRLKTKIGTFAGRTIYLLLMMTAGFVLIRPLVVMV